MIIIFPVLQDFKQYPVLSLYLGLLGLGALNIGVGLIWMVFGYSFGMIAVITGMISLNLGAVFYDLAQNAFHPNKVGIRAGISVFLVGLLWIYG